MQEQYRDLLQSTLDSYSKDMAEQFSTVMGIINGLGQNSPDKGKRDTDQEIDSPVFFADQDRLLKSIQQQQQMVRKFLDDVTGVNQVNEAGLKRSTENAGNLKTRSSDSIGRFADPAWTENVYFDFLRKTYLQAEKNLSDSIDNMHFKTPALRRQAQFIARQSASALSPSNFVLTNPQVMREVLNSGGKCLEAGWKNLERDIAQSPVELLKVSQSDPDAFELGKNLATTKGKVVFQNDLMQLIQYSPTTKTVYKIPLLIVPPFVNKFYVLDLEKGRSLVRWLISKGYTVFMISWINPDSDMASVALEDYVVEGICQAIEVTRQIQNVPEINTVGYCTGGTLLAIAQAWLKAKGRADSISNTFLATQTDFQDPGDLGVYLSDDLIPTLENYTDARGILDGRVLATAFNLLRENDLYWRYVIDNYLLGKKPKAFSILHWNNDSMNIPATLLNEYVKATYLHNNLCKSDELRIGGTGIDLARIDNPTYFLATVKDHIVPWQSVYRSSRYFGGDVRFVLGGSGHVAGVVNPAPKGKYPHWVNDRPAPDAQSWLEGALEQPGSWWADWNNWLKLRSGNRIAAGTAGSDKFPPLDEAPGSYVKVRI